MREAIGNSFVLTFIITFIVLFILIFVGTSTYTKAFKVKNKLIDTIEYYDGKIEDSDRLKSNVQETIDEKLRTMGYRIDYNSSCDNDGRYSDGTAIRKGNNDGFRYCIYRFNSNRGKRYAVVAYAYLEIPLINAKLDFPVYGETKTFLSF